MNYDRASGLGGYIKKDWMNIIPVIGESIRQFNGPYNISLSDSAVYEDYAIICISEDPSYIGGVNTSGYSNRRFSVEYNPNTVSGHYAWDNIRFRYDTLPNVSSYNLFRNGSFE